jgi:hypothetical protein
MDLSPSQESASCAAIQEVPRILWNQGVQHRLHKSPQLVPILNQFNLVHTSLPNLSKIHLNIVHPPTSWSS